MVFQGCSDFVESRVGAHHSRCRKPRECSFYFGFGTAPARQPLGDAPTSDNDSPRRAGLSIDELSDLSIDHIIASARNPVRLGARMLKNAEREAYSSQGNDGAGLGARILGGGLGTSIV